MRGIWSRLSLSGKVFLVCVGLALVASLGGGALIYQGARQSLREEVREKIEALARTTARQVSPSLHNQLKRQSDESSDAYRTIKALLASVRDANPDIRYVYTMRPTGRRSKWEFVVDAETDPKLVSHLGDPYDTSDCPAMFSALHESASDKEPTVDKWGTWLSGYAPIKDSRGHTVAIVGLDMSVQQLAREERSIRDTAVKSAGAVLLIAVLLSLIVTKALLRPVHTFTSAAKRVRGGDLDFQLPVKGTDEISEFGRAFNRMVAGLKESHERLMEQSSRDYLTGLFNHGYFQERLSVEIDRAGRFGRQLCLLIVDVDRFKSINDNLGHPVGDSVLRQLGMLLSTSLRKIDVASRYGGDEFALILPETDPSSGLALAERLRTEVENHEFYGISLDDCSEPDRTRGINHAMKLTVTIGVACFPDHHVMRDGLVMSADIALCRAKHVARNSVGSYDPAACGDSQVDPGYLYQILRDPSAAAIKSLAAALDAKDQCTHGHSDRVTEYALGVAAAAGLTEDQLDAVKIAGLLHDLGKIGVPDAILNKPGGLTKEERDVVMQHPSVGGNILGRAPQLDVIVPAVMFHHERWDGSGYPNGLSGDQIPLMARILAIADSFDAMTSDRPYRKAMSAQSAVTELRANAGKQFDPNLVEAFIASLTQTAQDKAA